MTAHVVLPFWANTRIAEVPSPMLGIAISIRGYLVNWGGAAQFELQLNWTVISRAKLSISTDGLLEIVILGIS